MAKLIEIPEGTDIIELRKKVSRMRSRAKEKAKPSVCILCGKA